MLNAKQSNLKTSDFEVNADNDVDHENANHSTEMAVRATTEKGLTMEVSVYTYLIPDYFAIL